MKRIRSIVALLLLVTLFAAMVPVSATAEKLMKVTNTNMLRMRTGPNEAYNVKARYKKGTVVTVLKYSRGWYYVRTKDGTKGWMSKNFLTKTSSGVVKAKESASGNAVAQKNVYMRKGPGTNYDRILTVKNGRVMKIIGRTGVWYKVRYNGKTGFVYRDLVKVVK
ncbi:MAG: SH3 domain-containing protein [Clostridia bacterium]|nr:SH3 domain-containing protein [Clostridia bacterium]